MEFFRVREEGCIFPPGVNPGLQQHRASQPALRKVTIIHCGAFPTDRQTPRGE